MTESNDIAMRAIAGIAAVLAVIIAVW